MTLNLKLFFVGAVLGLFGTSVLVGLGYHAISDHLTNKWEVTQ